MSVKLVTRRSPTLIVEEFEDVVGNRRFRVHLSGRAHLSGHGRTAKAAIKDLEQVIADLFTAIYAGSQALKALPRARKAR